MPHHTERDRERNDKNEQETGKPIQLDKDQKSGQQQHETQRPMEHQRPEHGGEERPSGGTKK